MSEKQFKIMNDCGDYHLLNGDEQLCYDLCSPTMRKTNWNNVVDKLNEQDATIKRLKEIREEQIETILKLKRKIQELQCTIEANSQDDYIDYLEKQNERLKERIRELAINDKIVFMIDGDV